MTWVVKIGGALLDDRDARARLWTSIGVAVRSGRVVLVHGGGSAVDCALDDAGRKSRWADGLRVTSAEDMPIVAGVLAGVVNKRLVAELRELGTDAAGLSLVDTGLACERLNDPDLGRVGRVVEGEATTLQTLLDAGVLPVVASIGHDTDGLLNINADDAAIGVAGALEARGLVLMTDVPGVIDAEGDVIREIAREDIDALISEGVISGGMVPKVRAASEAGVRLGVPAVIAPWSEPERLVGLIETGEPVCGTSIVPRRRPATA